MMGTSEELMERIRRTGAKTGDYVWPLPPYEGYEEQIKSDIADVKKMGGKYAGAINAALLLKKFVKDCPLGALGHRWDAEDVRRGRFPPEEYLPKGLTGVGVRPILQVLRDWSQAS